MSGIVQEVGIGALALAQMGTLLVAVKALARRQKEDARHAAVDAERVVCPVTMNGFRQIMEQMAQGQRDQTEHLREINERLAVLLATTRPGIGGVRER